MPEKIKISKFNFQNGLAALSLFLTIGYLGLVNYQLPFLAMDEIRSISATWGDSAKLVMMYGRPSQLIGMVINQAISFYSVEFWSLTPRLLTMVILVLSCIGFLHSIKLSWSASTLLTSFAILTHQLDWQHNGLIAFFGGYGLMLAFFIGGILTSEKKGGYLFLAYIFFLLSFASEFFVGLAFVYFLMQYIEERKNINVFASPIFYSICSYLIFYLVLKIFFQESIHSSHMNNYLVGSIFSSTPINMVTGTLLYLANSIPLQEFGPIRSFWISLLISLSLILLAIYVGIKLIKIYQERPLSKALEFPSPNSSLLAKYSIICCLIFAPAVLMSLQPMKLEWVLTGASSRYALSLYTWIGIIFLVGLTLSVIKNNLDLIWIRFATKPLLFSLIILSFIGVISNLNFVKSYSDSFNKWKELHSRLRSEDSSSLDLSDNLFQHPNIITNYAFDRKLIDEYIWLNYQKKIRICTDGYDMSGPLVISNVDMSRTGYISKTQSENVSSSDGIVDKSKIFIEGFHDAESNGRWTSGGVSKIFLPFELTSSDVIEIEVPISFADNSRLPTLFTVGENHFSLVIKGGERILIPIAHATPSFTPIVITPPAPKSPSATNDGYDSRVIGLMIKKIRILKLDKNGRLVHNTQVCN